MIIKIMLLSIVLTSKTPAADSLSDKDLAAHAQEHIKIDTGKPHEERVRIIDAIIEGRYRPLSRSLPESWKLEKKSRQNKCFRIKYRQKQKKPDSDDMEFLYCPVCGRLIEDDLAEPCPDCGAIPEEYF